jgi:hypothetical protein
LARAARCSFAGLHHPGQLPAQAHHLFVDGAAVGLDLGFAGAADETKPPR